MKHLRKRFIFFNILVISCIMVILAIFVGLSERSTLSANRMMLAILISIVLVFIGSWLLSKIALAPIKAAWQKQLDFTADASHELRTPLSIIQTNLDVVLCHPNATIKSQIKWLKNIEAENKRMSILVSNLLLLSRADTNEAIISMDNLNLSALLSEIITAYAPVAKQNKLILTSAIINGISIRGDSDKIKQLFIILLDNAIKYTAENGTISITLSQDGIVEISDTGIGIEQDEIIQVFNRFYRGKHARLHNPDGSGLGLSIAKLIAEEHGGKISAQSKIGDGSIFKVTLPISAELL